MPRPTRTWLRWLLLGAGALLVAVAALVLAYVVGPRRAPAGQPALRQLDQAQGLELLRQEFNAASDSPRLLVMLSPT